jgi:hypothetical protein
VTLISLLLKLTSIHLSPNSSLALLFGNSLGVGVERDAAEGMAK